MWLKLILSISVAFCVIFNSSAEETASGICNLINEVLNEFEQSYSDEHWLILANSSTSGEASQCPASQRFIERYMTFEDEDLSPPPMSTVRVTGIRKSTDEADAPPASSPELPKDLGSRLEAIEEKLGISPE
jgi:hypothetical protein